ncbi:hypothetical protein ACFX2J_044122 [Malus domestica]
MNAFEREREKVKSTSRLSPSDLSDNGPARVQSSSSFSSQYPRPLSSTMEPRASSRRLATIASYSSSPTVSQIRSSILIWKPASFRSATAMTESFEVFEGSGMGRRLWSSISQPTGGRRHLLVVRH